MVYMAYRSPLEQDLENHVQPTGIFAVSRTHLTNAFLFTINPTLRLLEELWQVLLPFMMTLQTPRLRLFWTEYGIKVMGCFNFAETLFPHQIAGQVSSFLCSAFALSMCPLPSHIPTETSIFFSLQLLLFD